MARSDNKRMKAFSKRLNEMRKGTPAAVKKAEEDTAPKLSSVETPKQKIKADLGNVSFAEAFRAARKNNPGEPFTWRGKSYSTALASEKKTAPKPAAKPTAKPAAKPISTSTRPPEGRGPDIVVTAPKKGGTATKADTKAKPKQWFRGDTPGQRLGDAAGAPFRAFAKYNPLSLAASAIFDGEPSKPSKPTAPKQRTFTREQQAKLEDMRKAAEAPGASRYAQDRYKYAKETGMAGNFKKGGSVKKYKKGGPVMESQRKPIDTRRAILGSDKEIVARGNRTPYEPVPKKGPDAPKRKPLGRAGAAGYKSGGSVMKKGADGIAKKGKTKGMMPKMNKGGACYAKGGSIDGIAKKGKTRCKGMK